MSRWPEDGHYHCDRCGVDVGNGGPFLAATVFTTRPVADDPAQQVRYDLCRDRPDEADPSRTVQGCEDRVLTRKALRSYRDREQAT